jgi:hypothetical protein
MSPFVIAMIAIATHRPTVSQPAIIDVKAKHQPRTKESKARSLFIFAVKEHW